MDDRGSNNNAMELESLSSTVGSFATRIKRQLKEQEQADTESQKATSARQSLMLKAMSSIRKALQETSKVALGERFKLELNVTDWEGWPKVELTLIDSLMPLNCVHSLVVFAHDRHEMGTVQIALRTGEVLGRVHLRDPDEFVRLPLVLKRSIRGFLDAVAAFVLKPSRPEDTLEHQSRPLEDTQLIETSDQTLSDDIFEEETNRENDNKVEQLEELIPLASSISLAK